MTRRIHSIEDYEGGGGLQNKVAPAISNGGLGPKLGPKKGLSGSYTAKNGSAVSSSSRTTPKTVEATTESIPMRPIRVSV